MTDTTRQDLDEIRSRLLREVADRLQNSTNILNDEGCDEEHGSDWDMCLIRAVDALATHNRALEQEFRAMRDELKQLEGAYDDQVVVGKFHRKEIDDLRKEIDRLEQQTAGPIGG